MALIPREAIKVLTPPQRTSPLKNGVDRTRRPTLPPPNGSSEIGPLLDHDVNVVGHYTPCKQSIANSVMQQQFRLDDLRAFGITQQACAAPCIQFCIVCKNALR